MRVLLDTCVLSELQKPQCNEAVKKAIMELNSEQLFLSIITIGEIIKGIALLKESKKKHELSSWLLNLEHYYADRILSIDLETSRIWGEQTAAAQKAGKIVSVSDGLISATAIRHGLHIMTRNMNDFKPMGAMLINPWEN